MRIDVLIVSIYVDDLIYTGISIPMVEEFKKSMMEEFSMTDLGKMKYFLEVEVIQDEKGIFINHEVRRRDHKEIWNGRV